MQCSFFSLCKRKKKNEPLRLHLGHCWTDHGQEQNLVSHQVTYLHNQEDILTVVTEWPFTNLINLSSSKLLFHHLTFESIKRKHWCVQIDHISINEGPPKSTFIQKHKKKKTQKGKKDVTDKCHSNYLNLLVNLILALSTLKRK